MEFDDQRDTVPKWFPMLLAAMGIVGVLVSRLLV